MATCEVPGCDERWAGSLRGVVLCQLHSQMVLGWVEESCMPKSALDHATVSYLVVERSRIPGSYSA